MPYSEENHDSNVNESFAIFRSVDGWIVRSNNANANEASVSYASLREAMEKAYYIANWSPNNLGTVDDSVSVSYHG